ncbi:GTPase-activating protein GYP5 [Gaeumannomyces tritici R3-111a-1]|uniref:GTPase-activating protein GYP5 n=1 Tax=Gaeumannomyces tritici (strain R3-111a-1) TaxID=644352 RepID=J3PCJ3_GAET3|nr:GTPase-activating protein GYP5 [Gaeumannomyces tritici R3-111a-1]EJT71963.1 GTPase-activating protein GYP5 [Gaeumannomyces tritici R3-111a-1]
MSAEVEKPVAAESGVTQEQRPLSPSSDSEAEDAFEDAPDTASIRSLTKRKVSVPRPESQPSELAAAFQKIKEKKSVKGQDATSPTAETTPVTKPKQQDEPDTKAKAPVLALDKPAVPPKDDSESDSDDSDDDEPESPSGTTPNRLPKISNGALDNVSLHEDAPTTNGSHKGGERRPSPTDRPAPKTLSLSSITHALPSMPWSPPANESPSKTVPTALSHAPAAAMVPPPPEPISRKLTSPFSWLSRNTSKDKDASVSPTVTSPRRNTASSIATPTSPDEERGGARNSLKDRFKLVRMREEAGITSLPEEDESEAPEATVKSTANALSPAASTPGGAGADGIDNGMQPPSSPLPKSPNPSLAPGTVSGVDAGPSPAAGGAPVDWDLWQSVVDEGPAAVARTSSEELNTAIAVGIPNVIRGVVWQVLAQSKNEGLELVYRELVARGTDKEKDRHSTSSLGTSSNSNLSIKQRGETASSASSVNSDGESTGSNSVKDIKDAEAAAAAAAVTAKNQAIALADRKKREKDEKTALQKLEKVIRKDLGMRTSFSKFAASQGLQDALFGVCKAYALFDEAVGYAQGMNFLVMPLLFNMPEEEAFCLLVRLMNHYKLRDLFIHDMPGLHKHLYQFERLIEDLEPALYCHLHRKGISSHLYATQWFLTLFAYKFPLQLVLRIYDLILSEGLSAILKFSVVLMQKNAAAMLQISDISALTVFLRDRLFDVYIDAAPTAGGLLESGFFGSSSAGIDKEVYRADQMVRDACDVRITPEMLALYTQEWEEKTAAEKARDAEITRRDAEIEELRGSNHAAAIKIRKLEEQLQANDSEQTTLATQVVHLKVENQELRDETETLREQVKTLRELLQDQPAELEKAWLDERAGLLERNEKVAQENRRVEREMADLEEQLVKTKMEYAEINSQHETLTRRWTDLKKQFA